MNATQLQKAIVKYSHLRNAQFDATVSGDTMAAALYDQYDVAVKKISALKMDIESTQPAIGRSPLSQKILDRRIADCADLV